MVDFLWSSLDRPGYPVIRTGNLMDQRCVCEIDRDSFRAYLACKFILPSWFSKDTRRVLPLGGPFTNPLLNMISDNMANKDPLLYQRIHSSYSP